MKESIEDQQIHFLWRQEIRDRGSQEVGSYLKYVGLNLKQGVEYLVLWSDSCGGQNRNIKIIFMPKGVLIEHLTLKIIYLNFLESGHGFLPNE